MTDPLGNTAVHWMQQLAESEDPDVLADRITAARVASALFYERGEMVSGSLAHPGKLGLYLTKDMRLIGEGEPFSQEIVFGHSARMREVRMCCVAT